MKTLFTLTVPLVLATVLVVPVAYAHPERDDYRNDRDRYYDYRADRRGDSHVFSRDTRRALSNYEWERRKRFAQAARRSERERAERERERRKFRAERERELAKRLREARRDHRHYDSRYYRNSDARYRRISHDDDVFLSIVLDVSRVY